jgi:DNA polymerase-3 subunit gamma/tau
LDEVVGQEHITAILKRAIAADKIAHAYLLTGPKGVGKTSIARILAHEINGLPYTDDTQHLDIIEIDAASNNSVEDVRDLRERVQIAPVSAKRKVYIIDEVHMLSKQAFNALLKTLEEPPAHIVFILATTDADKLPATILSRVQRLNFRAISEDDAVKHLQMIAKKEKINIEADALTLIAAHGQGSFRDSISLLDQMQHVSDGKITREQVASVLGLADTDFITALMNSYQSGDLKTIVTLLDTAAKNGTAAGIISGQLIRTSRANITEQPNLFPLLDELLEVQKSAWPEVKLLTALARGASLGAPTTTPTPVSAPAKPTPIVPKQKPAAKPQTGKVSSPELAAEVPAEPAEQTAPSAPKAEVNFEWVKFIEQLKADGGTGPAAVLSGCSHVFDGETLTIYAGKKFNKARLDKAMSALLGALANLGIEAIITVKDTPKPPADATTAAILDIMGGGEEVNAN